MRKIQILGSLAAGLILAASSADAEEYVTLANSGDVIELKAGETALVVSTSDKLVLEYDKGIYHKRRTQIRFDGSKRGDYQFNYRITGRDYYVPSWDSPFPLAGPCKIKLMTPGVVGMRLIGGGE